MTTTITPTVYALHLSCGHVQLATRSLSVGAAYPCWSACDSDQVTPAIVLDSKVYRPDNSTGLVVCSGISRDDMIRVNRIVDEMNTKPKKVKNGTYDTLNSLLDVLESTSIRVDDFIATKVKIQMVLHMLADTTDDKFVSMHDMWKKMNTLHDYSVGIQTLRNIIN